MRRLFAKRSAEKREACIADAAVGDSAVGDTAVPVRRLIDRLTAAELLATSPRTPEG